MHTLVERSRTPLFGHKKRAGLIVDWSNQSPEGAKAASPVHASGIRLEAHARGECPRVYLYFNPGRLKATLDGPLKGLDRLSLIHKGISVNCGPDKEVSVRLLALPSRYCTLWAGPVVDDRRDVLLGMIELGYISINFYKASELKMAPERVEALAVIGSDRTTQLSPRSKAFLMKDAALNLVLKR